MFGFHVSVSCFIVIIVFLYRCVVLICTSLTNTGDSVGLKFSVSPLALMIYVL